MWINRTLSFWQGMQNQETLWKIIYWFLTMLNMWVCVQLCTTFHHPMDCSLPMKFSKQEQWSGLPIRTPGYLPNPGIKLMYLVSPAFAGKFFTTIPLGNVKHSLTILFNNSASRYIHSFFEIACPYNDFHMNCLYVINRICIQNPPELEITNLSFNAWRAIQTGTPNLYNILKQ